MPPFRPASARRRANKTPRQQDAAPTRRRASKTLRHSYTRDLPDTQREIIQARIPPQCSGGDRRLPDRRNALQAIVLRDPKRRHQRHPPGRRERSERVPSGPHLGGRFGLLLRS